MNSWYSVMPSPIGELSLVAGEQGLEGLHFGTDRIPIAARRDDAAFAAIRAQLEEYFAGSRREFTVALAPRGTPFQLAVWEALRSVPYATTVSYGTIASRIGRPTATRAVGQANNRNPIAIIVPCHRVIGADGSLTGYGGGLDCKRVLLDLERIAAG